VAILCYDGLNIIQTEGMTVMSTDNGLKKQLSQTIERLPESSLREVATFLEYLQYRDSLSRHQPATPYRPVALGGLWQGVTITDEDIDEVRREMWTGFGERDI
jgi:hypothetical protein